MNNKPKFNLLDAVIILLVLAVIAGGIYLKFAPGKTEAPPAQNAETVNREKGLYTIEITRVDRAVADEFELAFQNKETLRCGEKEVFNATIKDVYVKPSTTFVVNQQTGTAQESVYPDQVDILLLLETDITETNNAVMAGNTPLRVGNALAVKGSKCAGYGYIINLDLE